MVSSFLSGVASGAAPAFARQRRLEDTRQLRASITQAEGAYLAQKDQLLNLAAEEDWDPNKVDEQLATITTQSLASPDLQKDPLLFAQLEKALNSNTRNALNGYRNKHEGKVEAVEEAEYLLQLNRGFGDISDRARGGGPAGEFSGGFNVKPFGTAPSELLEQHSEYLAGTLEDVAQDQSLEGQARLASRLLSAEKAINSINRSYTSDYNKYQNNRLDSIIEAMQEAASGNFEDAARTAFTHLNTPLPESDSAAMAATDPRSLATAFNYEAINALAAQRGKTYFEVTDTNDLQKSLGSMLALDFLKKNSALDADTDSTMWKSMVKTIENMQDDSKLSSVFYNAFGEETARFVKANTTQILTNARGIVNTQRPTIALQEDRYNQVQDARDDQVNQAIDSNKRTSALNLSPEIQRIYQTAIVSPDSLMAMSWVDQGYQLFENELAAGVYGPPRLFGDNSRVNDRAVKNQQKARDAVLDRVNNTRGVMQYPGKSSKFIGSLSASEQNVVLSDVVQFTKPELNDIDLYSVEGTEFSAGARDAVSFLKRRGFAPPAFIDFIENQVRTYELELSDPASGDRTQQVEDRSTVDFLSQTLNTLLNSKLYRQLPQHQAAKLEAAREALSGERDAK
jgi:hypothetical protein